MPRNTGGADAMEELGLGPGDTLIGKNPGLPLKSVENAAQLERNKGWALRVDPGGGKSFVLQQGTSIMKNWKSMVDGQRDRISKIKTKADREVRAERAKCKTLQQDQMRLQGAEARLRRELAECLAREAERDESFRRKAEDWRGRIERADRESQRSSKLVAEFGPALQRLEAENRALRADGAALRARLAERATSPRNALDPIRAVEEVQSRLEKVVAREVDALRAENKQLRLELLEKDAALLEQPAAPEFPERPPASKPAGSAAAPAPPPEKPRARSASKKKKRGSMAVRGQSASLYADRAYVRVDHPKPAPIVLTSRHPIPAQAPAPSPAFAPRPAPRQPPRTFPPPKAIRPCSAPPKRPVEPADGGGAPRPATATPAAPPASQAPRRAPDAPEDRAAVPAVVRVKPTARPSTAPPGRDKRDSPRALKIYMPVATNAPAAARPPSPVYAKGLALAKSPSRAPSADDALGDLDGPPPA